MLEATPADFNLKAADLPAGVDAFDVAHRAPPGHFGTEFSLRRLVSAARAWRYVGVTHEYLAPADGGAVASAPLPQIAVIHHADGGSRSDKFERDKRLLEAEVARDASDARARFYLANTYRDLGDCARAAPQYEARAALGGWREEVYLSHLEAGRCRARLGAAADAARAFEAAFRSNPRRQEAAYELAAQAYRARLHGTCFLWAREAVGLGDEAPPGSLFVERAIYRHGSLDHVCICAFWVGRLAEGAAACRALVARLEADVARAGGADKAPRAAKEVLARTRDNLGHYERACAPGGPMAELADCAAVNAGAAAAAGGGGAGGAGAAGDSVGNSGKDASAGEL